MNKQEKEYFDALSKKRAEFVNILEDPDYIGFMRIVTEKYSDQAHFIYELLQNADDAEAKNARFILEKDRLIFAHDGKRHFSITDPANTRIDSSNKTIGDINSITAIGNSNKKGSSIGKFGIGFKAVFQYTSTPHIYDSDFKFKIERFIVPVSLDEDFPGRKKNETLFVFPFNHQKRSADVAYNDISEKLKKLKYPLLFLSNIENIEFEFNGKDGLGLYKKTINREYIFENTKAEHITLTQNDGDDFYDVNLYLFSRTYDRGEQYNNFERYLKYSIGFFIDKNGHLLAVNEPAFCFFPTKEVTGLNFILHAPFLLTDSREGIKAGEEHNEKMIEVLSDLAADAIEYLKDIGSELGCRLIDDNIINIVPINRFNFSDPSDKSKISFLPFYEKIKNKFKTTKLLPTSEGYVDVNNAYWASVPQLPQLFSNEQLGKIVDNADACWVFITLSRDGIQSNNKELSSYLDSLVRTNINEDIIINGRTKDFYVRDGIRQDLESIKGISGDFIEKQPIEWLHNFYKWISDTTHRREIIKRKPIFLDQEKKAAAAFDNAKQLILFLPVPNTDMGEYRVVNSELLKDEKTKKFIEEIGIKQPSLKDQIYTIILPQFDKGGDIDVDSYFMRFFDYFCGCPNEEVNEFIKLIKDKEFLTYFDSENQSCYAIASSMYLPTDELRAYFEPKADTCFIALEKYKKMVGSARETQLIDFLIALGIKTEIEIKQEEIFNCYERVDLPRPNKWSSLKSYELNILDGCAELIDYIEMNKDSSKSIVLWNSLLRIIKVKCPSWYDLGYLLSIKCKYTYYSSKYEYFPSEDAKALKTKAWIKRTDGEFVAVSDITVGTLASEYETTTESAQKLIWFLGIKETEVETTADEESDVDSNLTDEQREKIDLANLLKENGIDNKEKLEELLKEYKRKKEAQQASSKGANYDNHHKTQSSQDSEDEDFDLLDEEIEDNSLETVERDGIKDIVHTGHKNSVHVGVDKFDDADEDIDEDEYMPSSANRKIERAKEKSTAEIKKIKGIERLKRIAENENRNNKYSYKWFTTLLEMECMSSDDSYSKSREISISFAKVEREPGTKRTLLLKHPSRFIPQFMEDLADISMVLHMGDQTKKVAIEVANVQQYTLRVKMQNEDAVDGIDLNTVTSATIDAQSPAFLLEELKKQFEGLKEEFGYDDDFNLQKNLCENIEFVFGPPGTGKTTHLAKNVLIPMMKGNPECKVLVLTPTNKAADVLVRRIMEVSGSDQSYNDWLVRFGATGDEEIEQSPVYKDKTFDIKAHAKNVTVTTIARFPYDYFIAPDKRIHLYALNWDYIVIDEASMIPIANIVLPLYKKTPKKFIIAGDPFQIEPIASVDLWKDENIYKMVKLESFSEPTTIPHKYKVELLTTQYRSVPDIGSVFSRFAYGGILKHHRAADSQRTFKVGDRLKIKTFNIVKFPVSKYESIYRCKRLKHSSSYQVYSALFTFEYACYLAKAIAENNPEESFKIGIIAPYRAQADMIDKLFASEKLPKTVDVQVGTIHGFQGDECDIIFAVFNTPPTISKSKEMFLNKMNIINVSISRARDYLFVIMPDENTENISNLELVNRVELLIKSTNSWQESLSPDLEELMFGDSKYLENNAFSTSHQSVNVYGLPEKCYEVRTEDNAVDVQIHKTPRDGEDEQADTGIKSSVIRQNYSYNLDESVIPEELKKDAIDLTVKGALNGWCYLAPYEGKLRDYTSKNPCVMYIPVKRNGQERKIPVSVIEKDCIIFISKDMFEKYEEELSKMEGIELKRKDF